MRLKNVLVPTCLFLFFTTSLLLFARDRYHYSDGFFEYSVATALLDHGRADLPAKMKPKSFERLQQGRGGRYYCIYGLGFSLAYIPAIIADRLFITAFGNTAEPSHPYKEPFFFANTLNAFILGLTGTCLAYLFIMLGIHGNAALFTAVLYVFCTMAFKQSTESFDISLFALLMALCYFSVLKHFIKGSAGFCLLAGFFFGGAFVTRLFAGIFFPLLCISFFLPPAGATCYGKACKALACFIAGALPLVLGALCYNLYRFGSLLETGYTTEKYIHAFTAPLSKTVPILLLSPGRGIVLFALPIVFSLFGCGRLIKKNRRFAFLVLTSALCSFIFSAKWSMWATPFTWGPRLQLLTVLLLHVPVAFWVDAVLAGTIFSRKALLYGVALIGAVTQAAPALIGYPWADINDLWSLNKSQLAAATGRILKNALALDGTNLQLWWRHPRYDTLPCTIMLYVIVAVCLLSAVMLLKHWGRTTRA